MQKLLIATNFSAASTYAYTYAEWLAVQFKAQLIVVHVAPFPQVEDTLSPESRKKLLQQTEDDLLDRLTRFATPYPDRDNPAVTAMAKPKCIVRFGKVIEQVEQVAVQEGVEALIIGTRSKHSFWEHLFGSVATAIIRHTRFPLLIIPEKANYKSVNQIGFAIAISLEEAIIFPQLSFLAGLFGATVQPFYVNTAPEEANKFKEEPIQVATTNEGSDFSNILMIRETSVLRGIDYFLQKYPCEMLALYVPDRDHFETFFHVSVSKQAAYHVQIPLVILKG